MILNAYYFQHHTFTVVPRHVREDMEWMADVGTTALTLAVLEQDLYANKANMDIICREAERAGISVHAVPSRWGGLLAGAPKVPSLFTATHPETWILQEDGSPLFNDICGPTSSIHHPATFEFFCKSLEELLAKWPIKGIVFDEPKIFDVIDWSPMARAALSTGAGREAHIDAAADFYDRVGAYARQCNPEIVISMFLQAHDNGYAVERCARISTLDYFGCDGRPWRPEDGGPVKGRGKELIDQARRFLSAAKKNGKGGLILIENITMSAEHCAIMDRHLPQVLQYGAAHVLYYYYGLNVDDPDRAMAVVAKHLKGLLPRVEGL